MRASRPPMEALPARAAPKGAFGLSGEYFAERYSSYADLNPAGSRDEPPGGVPEQGIPVEFVQSDRT